MTEKINQKSKNKPDIVLVLHNIRSTHNVGSLFRSADGAGVSQVILSGYTPTPIDKYGRNRGDIAKTALGAELSLPWQQIDSLSDFIKQKRDEGFLVSAIEQSTNSVHYKKSDHLAQKQVLILGNEVLGVDAQVLSLCDQIIEIPMAGDKESLNVSIAGAVVLFEILS